MAATWKGTLQLILASEEPVYDAETGIKFADRVWVGREDVVRGWGNELEEAGISYQIFAVQPPLFSISARVPLNDPVVENLDRYEISTEAQDKSIFEAPDVIADAAAFDASISEAAETYRERAENAVKNQDIGPTALFGAVVEHLKAGVTGYQIDFIVLRRFRQIDTAYGYAAGRMNLGDGLAIYTTAQLNLPSTVAFQLPATPSAPSANFAWGWRVRGQRVEIVGNLVEQMVELVFAPWTTIPYYPSASNLAW